MGIGHGHGAWAGQGRICYGRAEMEHFPDGAGILTWWWFLGVGGLWWWAVGWSETDEIFEKLKKSKYSNNFKTASQH